jgi:hypothetical protein
MENFKYMTVIVHTGAVTAGKKIAIRKATTNGGAGATTLSTPFIGGVYYKNATKSKADYTAYSAASSGKYISVGNSDDSRIFVATVEFGDMGSSYDYVNAQAVSAAWNAVMGISYILHGNRYHQTSAGFDPTQ